MSKTFEVHPNTRNLPTFAEVQKSTEEAFHSCLHFHNIAMRPKVAFHLLSTKTNLNREPIVPKSPFEWDHDTYLWVSIEGMTGGIDVYKMEHKEDHCLGDLAECLSSDRAIPIKKQIESALKSGYYWLPKLSAFQSLTMHLLLGAFAGALATRTDGLLYSIDGAWLEPRMPISGEAFLYSYFRTTNNFRDLEQQDLQELHDSLQEELQGLK